jgi:cell division protein FtsI/penicillin-binding protein 2
MHSIVLFFSFLFCLLYYKLNLIFIDPKIHAYALQQYKKKEKNKCIRGNIYDKNNLLLNYTKKKYIINKKNKKQIIEKREYLFPSCIAINGIVNNEFQGLSGLELFYNNELNLKIIQTYRPRMTGQEKFKIKYKKQKKNNLMTTLDAIQSEKVYRLLNQHVDAFKSQYGICIVMDGETGALETVTQYPQYTEDTKNTINMKFLYPLSVTQSHEIGSVMKAFLMLAAFNENIVTPETIINCFGVKEKNIQGKILTTWKAHGLIPFKTVIKESNNFGVAQIGLLLNEKLFNYYSHFGFGKKTDIPIHGEHTGILNTIDKWSKRSPISLSFGYEISCSLLQLVSAWSVFTNAGKRVFPKILINQQSKYSGVILNKQAINDSLDVLHLPQESLKKHGLKKDIDGNLYGKTGTANTLINKEYNKDLNIYTFIGHIEKNNIKKIIGISLYGSNNSKLLSSQVSLPIFLAISDLIAKKIGSDT